MVDDVIVRALLEEGLYPYAGERPEESLEPWTEAPPGGVAVTIEGLTKSFGGNHVLHGIDLQIQPGEQLC